MAPTIVRSPDGTMMAFGSPGGATIITTVVGMAINLIDFGHPLTPVPEIGAAVGLVIQADGSILAAAEPSRRGGGAAMVVER